MAADIPDSAKAWMRYTQALLQHYSAVNGLMGFAFDGDLVTVQERLKSITAACHTGALHDTGVGTI